MRIPVVHRLSGMTAAIDAPRVLRLRLIDAATELTARDGWPSVTMSRLAERVGVSRQTVYNEIGSKPALAEAMVMRELDLFLRRVDEHFEGADNLIEAIRGAARGILEMAREDPLLRAVLSASHGADNDLLPLLTTHSEALIESASAVIREHVVRFPVSVSEDELDLGIDSVVRLVLSHVMQPAKEPAEVADDLAWMAERLLQSR